MHRCEAGNDEICLCGCACARIAQFTSQDQEWLAINDELPSTTFHSDLRQFGGIEGQNTKANESSTQREGAPGDRQESSKPRLFQSDCISDHSRPGMRSWVKANPSSWWRRDAL